MRNSPRHFYRRSLLNLVRSVVYDDDNSVCVEMAIVSIKSIDLVVLGVSVMIQGAGCVKSIAIFSWVIRGAREIGHVSVLCSW